MEITKENLSEEYHKLLIARSFHKYFIDSHLQGKEYYISFQYGGTNQVLINFEFKGFVFKDILKEIPFAKYRNGTLGESGLITLNLDDLSELVDREAEDKFLKEEHQYNLEYEIRLRDYNLKLDQVQDSEEYLCIPLQVGRYYNFQLDISLKGNDWKNLESDFRQELEWDIVEKLQARLLPKKVYRVKSQLGNGKVKSLSSGLFEFRSKSI